MFSCPPNTGPEMPPVRPMVPTALSGHHFSHAKLLERGGTPTQSKRLWVGEHAWCPCPIPGTSKGSEHQAG